MRSQDSSTERFFGRHAARYAKSHSHAHGDDLAVLIEALGPRLSDVALDVATGTGFTAVALARHVKGVTGIDVTEQMLKEARKLATTERLTNVKFETGEALGLAYSDSSFDIVTTRRAAHHFKDVPRFLREARRVLKPGGRLGVADMSPPGGAEAFSNEVERLRDGSHAKAFSPAAWKTMMSDAGFHITFLQVLAETTPFEDWIYPVQPGGDEEASVRRAWAAASPAVKQLLHAEFEGGTIARWTKSRIVLIADRPVEP